MIELQQVSVNYGQVRALKDVSLKISEREIVTLIGANGAGKSTTLNTISGIVKPSSGTIYFKGENINRLSPSAVVRRGITQVPEERRLFPDMSVEENLRIGAYTVKSEADIEDRIARVMDLFPIMRERNRQLAGTLSGGEQQMVAIARGLMAAPSLILLDEPSLGLAPLIVRDVARIIREIHSQGLTILLVEQNAHMALHVADRGYVLETGSVVKEDTGANLLKSDDVRRAYLGK